MAWSISGSSDVGLDGLPVLRTQRPADDCSRTNIQTLALAAGQWTAVFATACRQGKPGQLSCPTRSRACRGKMTEMLEPQGHLAGTGSGTTGGSYRPAPVVPPGRSGTSHWDSGTTELSRWNFRACALHDEKGAGDGNLRDGAAEISGMVVVEVGVPPSKDGGSSFRGGMA
jgi:hypothetical protein